ncbi:MAG: NAD(P)H-quinone oxidoreductase [Ilumatobacteraceae bacterium]|jgi:putative PIG3 family NAD(P)H quinone oxidoreductase|nr:NAD(P)H-quinone oxidoreductase [Ilumatobacteraceae bacterium]MDP5068605.1 NAD(P)H-quinone oxidoreductase [Ilumatobacteraceae bacterium]
MRAVVLRSHGGPDVLQFEDVASPIIGEQDILVTVAATALNRADLLQRMGFYPNPFPSGPEIPGLEFAGTVAAIGDKVTAWSIGDRVMGIASGGAYAEQLAIHERQAMAVPSGMSLHDAAGIPEVFITAWDALVVQGGLTSGRWAMVHAGASGVGTAAIQICKAIGARIVVTCSGGKVEACRALGADVVVDYGTQDFVAEVATATGGAGVDVILDVIGGDYVERNVASLAVKGHIIQVGVMAGKPVPFNVGLLLGKRASITGTVLRARPLEEKIAISQRFASEMLPLFSTGQLKPVIDSVYAFADIASAHEYMATNGNVGKIVITVA